MQTSRRGPPVCAATVFDEGVNMWKMTLTEPVHDAVELVMGPEVRTMQMHSIRLRS